MRVRNWRRFQHYSDRNPPWIKLHFSLLSSSDWVMLDDQSRLLAIVCMLLASRNEGEIDVSESGLAYIQRVAYLTKKPNIKPLIDCGFLEDASTCKQTQAKDTTETEERRDREEERRGEIALSPKGPRPIGSGEVLITIPDNKGQEIPVCKTFADEMEKAYPIVDVLQTLREIRAWAIANPQKRKTASGMSRFVQSWLSREQNRGA